MPFEITSSAFEEGAAIPVRHTCQGEDVSPPLQWSNVPAAAKSLALICEDPDAPMGTWVHWVVYDIATAFSGFTEGVPTSEVTPNGAKQGSNDFGRIGYGGPCPPPGGPHRYFFKLYALDIEPGLPVSATRDDLLRAVEGHIVAECRLMGRYEKA